MPSITAPVQILCYFLVQILLGLSFRDPVRYQLQFAFILYGVTALFGPIFVPLLMTKTFRGKFFQLSRCSHQLRYDSCGCSRLHFRLVWIPECLHSADVQRQLFDGDVARKSHSLALWYFIAFIINMLFIPSLSSGDLRRSGRADFVGHAKTAEGQQHLSIC